MELPINLEITQGERRNVPSQFTAVDQLVGKTVEAVGASSVQGPNGDEPMTVLLFTDATWHGFVHPADE